jgi:NAD(P)-dependent dehydrogenase (short-subunit alcohol dehydrogenase family)
MDLDRKVALVTGASRGVGAAIAEALAAEGVLVACAARSTDAAPHSTPGTLDGTVSRITAAGGTALAVPTNLAEPSEVERMVTTTLAELGRVDILVNNAAITFPGDVDLPMKRFDLVFAVDVHACVHAAQLVVPGMKERREGAILNLSSIAGLNYFPGLMAYGMAKAALEHHTMSMAAQLRPLGIAVNTFRIDVPVASEGFVANAPGVDHTNWEPCSVAAEGVVWMLRQPPEYTGRQEGMAALRDREGIMASQVPNPVEPGPGLTTDTHLRLPDAPTADR